MKHSMPDYTNHNNNAGVDDQTNAGNDQTDNEAYDAFLEQQDMVDIDLEDILEVEEDIPVETDVSTATVNHTTEVDRRTKLGLYMPPPLRIRTPEEIAKEIALEERKRAIREEENMMVAAGYKYVRAEESKGEALLSQHPYLAQYQVRQRSLLRNAWVWQKDEDDGSDEEEWENLSVHMNWTAGDNARNGQK